MPRRLRGVVDEVLMSSNSRCPTSPVGCLRVGPGARRFALVLMLDIIQFFEAESPEEDRLVEALWAASAGEHLDEGSLAVARALVR